MKLQKTILAASLAIVAANAAFAANPAVEAHHVQNLAEDATYLANYGVVLRDTTGALVANGSGDYVWNPSNILTDTTGAYVVIGGSNVYINTSQTQNAVKYAYNQLVAKEGANLTDTTHADYNAAFSHVWSELGGSTFAAPVATHRDTNGKLTALGSHTLVYETLQSLDYAYQSNSSAGSSYLADNGGLVSPVYGKNNIMQTGLGRPGFFDGVDLGSRQFVSTEAQAETKYQIFKYKDKSGNDVYKFYSEDAATTPAFGGKYFNYNATTGMFSAVAATVEVDTSTRQRGGQVIGSSNVSGEEIKVLTTEHMAYGFKSYTQDFGINQGQVVVPGSTDQQLNGNTVQLGTTQVNHDYINVGVIANTLTDSEFHTPDDAWRADHYARPDKSIYGISAKQNNNLVMLTGDGIALADLTNGKVRFDGSVVRTQGDINDASVYSAQFFEGAVGGKTLVKVSDIDNPKTTFEPKYYTLEGNKLVEFTGEVPLNLGNPNYTGTALAGSDIQSSVDHNTVTNKLVTYSEKVDNATESMLVRATNPSTAKSNDYDIQSNTQFSQSVQLGIIGAQNGKNKYGVVVNYVDGANSSKTEITAHGILTDGVVDAKAFKVDGKDITDFLKTGVAPEPTDPTDPTNPGTGTGGVTETQVNTKVEAAKTEAVTTAVTEAKAYTDTKVEGAIKTASADVTATATKAAVAEATAQVEKLNKATLASAQSYTDAAVNKVSKRLDDVEKTANAGVAIALAAQQAVPNVQPGQVAVFGGVGHYEGETAVSLGAVTSFTDRISGSGAVGVADGSFGARVGISYLFGGK